MRKQHKMSSVLNSPVLVCWNWRFEHIVGRCLQNSVLCLGDWNKVYCQYISHLILDAQNTKFSFAGPQYQSEQRFIDIASIVPWLRYQILKKAKGFGQSKSKWHPDDWRHWRHDFILRGYTVFLKSLDLFKAALCSIASLHQHTDISNLSRFE